MIIIYIGENIFGKKRIVLEIWLFLQNKIKYKLEVNIYKIKKGGENDINKDLKGSENDPDGLEPY